MTDDMKELVVQLRENGWATLPLSTALREQYLQMIQHADWFFDQQLDVKAAIDIRSSTGHRGWVPADEAGSYDDEGVRRYEAFDVGRQPRTQDSTDHPLRGPNQWPDGPVGVQMCGDAQTLFATLSDLALHVGDAVCDDLHLSRESLRQLRREPVSQLRLIRYFDHELRSSRDAEKAAMGAHTDYEFFTFLFQSAPGTQILDEQGRWIEVPYDGVATVLVGDMLEVFSNGTYCSAMHRAAPAVNAGRVSIPFFVGADFDAMVYPATIGPRTEGVNFGEHLMRQLARDFPYLRADHASHPHRSEFEEKALRDRASTS